MDAAQALQVVDRLYARLNARRAEIERFESYFRGEQPLAYATDAWKKEHAARYKDFSDNWCSVVGPAAAERTEVTGIHLDSDAPDDAQPQDAAEKALWRDWLAGEGPLLSAQGFLTSSIARRSAAIVWGNGDDEPVLSWEHPSQVIFDYEPGTRRVRYILKAWVDDDRELATLYTAEALWKWQRSVIAGQVVNGVTSSGLYVVGSVVAGVAGGWQPREPRDTGDDTWPLANPLGEPPGREFEHKPQLRGEPLSRIDGTIAMQDAINMLWAYLFSAADFAAMPARVVMGQEPPKLPILDANGQKVGEKPVSEEALTRGRMLWLTGEKTTVGQWEAAKLDVFTAVINVAVKHTASQTKTPIHYIVGDLGNVNGETLTATETPLANDVRDDHRYYGPAMRGLFRLMALVRNQKAVAEACRTATVQWANPATRSEAQLADAALKDRQQGFPLEWIATKRYGYSQAEVAELLEMVARDPSGAGVLNDVLRSIGDGAGPGAA